MGKPYAVAAIITMVIGSSYILYTSFYVQSQGMSIPVASEAISTTSESVTGIKTEVVKPVAEKVVVPTPANMPQALTLGDVKNLHGLTFKQPLNFTLERESNVSDDPGYVFLSKDYVKATPATSLVGADNNGLKKGTRISVTNHTAQVASSIATPEAYQTFQFDLTKDCSNCKSVKKVMLAGVPALFMIRSADDYGGSASYAGYYNGRMFWVGVEYTDNYEAHAELLNTFISGIKFTN